MQHVPYFNFIYGSLTGNDCEVPESVRYLREWPLDLVNHSYRNSHRADLGTRRGYVSYAKGTRAIPPRESGPSWDTSSAIDYDGGEGGRGVMPPSRWLMDYWMGRYYGFIEAPTTGRYAGHDAFSRGPSPGVSPRPTPARPARPASGRNKARRSGTVIAYVVKRPIPFYDTRDNGPGRACPSPKRGPPRPPGKFVSRLDMAGSRGLGDGLKCHAHRLGSFARKVQPFEPDDAPLAVFHQHHLFARLLADVFCLRTPKPDSEGAPRRIIIDIHFGHVRTPSLMASVGYAVMRKPEPSSRFVTAQTQRRVCRLR